MRDFPNVQPSFRLPKNNVRLKSRTTQIKTVEVAYDSDKNNRGLAGAFCAGAISSKPDLHQLLSFPSPSPQLTLPPPQNPAPQRRASAATPSRAGCHRRTLTPSAPPAPSATIAATTPSTAPRAMVRKPPTALSPYAAALDRACVDRPRSSAGPQTRLIRKCHVN